jgi:hypothetical protein
MRWTLRGVDEDVIRLVQVVQKRTGRRLGEIVSDGLRIGLHQNSSPQTLEDIVRQLEAQQVRLKGMALRASALNSPQTVP